MKKRLLAMCLALLMIAGMLPLTAFAAVTGWSAEHSTTPITATGTYTISKADADWTGIVFKAPVEDDYTFAVANGQCGMGGAASYYVYKPSAPAQSYTRTMKANAQFVLMMQSNDDAITLTITRANEAGATVTYTDWTNVHTPADEFVAAPANPTVLTDLESHSIYKISDTDYRLDSADGKQLFVDMRYNSHFDLHTMYSANGVLSLHGSYNGVAYNFYNAMKAYKDVMAAKVVITENANGSTTESTGLYWYPLTTDIIAFLQGYGSMDGDGKWYDLTTAPNAWMFCLYTEADPAVEPGETEPEITEPEETEPEITEPEETEPEVTDPSQPEVVEPVEKAFDDVYNDNNPITAQGTYDVTLLDNTVWTMFLFQAPEIGTYTISVDKGVCGYAGVGSFYTMVPTKPDTSFERSITAANQGVVIAVKSEDPNVQITITKPDTYYTNVHTPDAALAGMPAGAEAVDMTATNAVVMVSDGEYRLNTEIGPQLYVDLSAIEGFDDIAAGGNAYGKMDGITYNFGTAMQAYGAAAGDTNAYPLTTDLITFLKVYGEAQGWYADATVAEPWMFCVYADTGSGDLVEITTVAEITNQSVAAEVPHQITWTATEKGTLNIAATPEYAANQQYTAFKVLIYANAGDEETVFEGGVQVPGDPWFEPQTAYEVEAGQYVVIELYAMKAYTHCDGTVNANITFVPYTSENTEKEELAWDDVYDSANPITAEGTYELTLNENAVWTMYQFTPEVIGFYTITVDGGNQVGYAGATSAYFYVPTEPGTSFEQEISALGNAIIFAVSGDSSSFNVTVEKTGESQGEQIIEYTQWENVHTPDASLVGKPETATAVDITAEHTVYMINDGEYRLDSVDGPVLYVNLSNNVFTFSELFGEYGALTLRGEYNGVNYDFKDAMSAYNDVMNGTYWYPLTTDLVAFLQGYGAGAAWYDQGYSPIQSVILGTAKTPWMFCVYSAESVTEPEPTEPTEPEVTEPEETEPEASEPVGEQQIASFTDVAVTANGPHIVTGTAPSAGTLHIEMAGTGWRFQVITSTKEYTYQKYSAVVAPVVDYKLAEGETYTVKFWAYDSTAWSSVDGTVSGTVTFIPDDGTVEQVELAFDDVYNGNNPITATGTHSLTLLENTQWTMFVYEPTEIGIYTITVSSGDMGYAGGTVSYFNVPQSFGSSLEREVKEVGNVVIFAIRNDDPNVTVTIEKTGESEGNIEHEYIPWENVHTPTADLTVPGGLEVVDITVAHTIVKISDTEYRLDSATGPIIYVDLEGTRDDGWSMSLSFPEANTIRAEYNGVYYNFRAPLSEYRGYYETDENGDRVKDENGNEIYHEPQNYGMGEYYDVMSKQSYRYRLTTDLLAFIQGWGVAQGWTIPNMSPFAAIADGTAHPDSAWMVVCMTDPNSVITNPEPEPEAKIESASVTLDSVLGVNFKGVVPEGCSLKVRVGSAEAVELEAIDGVYTVKVMAQDMMKNITAAVYDAEGSIVVEKTFKLADYVAAIQDDETQSEETKALAYATLTYCQYAAKVKGNYDGQLNELAEIPEDAFAAYPFAGSAVPAPVSIHCYLEEACQIRIRVLSDAYTVLVDGVEVELKQVGTTYVGSTGLLLAQDYDKEHSFVVMDGETEVFSGSYSVLAYLGACLDKQLGSADMQNLLIAMYYYHMAAAAYQAAV